MIFHVGPFPSDLSRSPAQGPNKVQEPAEKTATPDLDKSQVKSRSAGAQNTILACTHILRMPLSVKLRFRNRPGEAPFTLI